MNYLIDWPTVALVSTSFITVMTFIYKLLNKDTIGELDRMKQNCPINPAVNESIVAIKTELHEFRSNSKEHWEKIDKKFDAIEDKLDSLTKMILLHVGGSK